jgi:hypothetical protein
MALARPLFFATVLVLASNAAVDAALGTSSLGLPVSYMVEERALKHAVAGTPLTFELFADPGCTSGLSVMVVNIEDVTSITSLRPFQPKGAPKRPPTAELKHVMSELFTASSAFLKVSGVGIKPVGGACQRQGATPARPLLPAITLVIQWDDTAQRWKVTHNNIAISYRLPDPTFLQPMDKEVFTTPNEINERPYPPPFREYACQIETDLRYLIRTADAAYLLVYDAPECDCNSGC